MDNIQLLNERVNKLDAVSKEVDNEIANSANYKNPPKYLKELKDDIQKQKDVCNQEKQIIQEYKYLSSEMHLAQQNLAVNEKELKAAIENHEKLKDELGRKYPATYNSKTNTIDNAKWSQKDIEKYEASRKNRDDLKQAVAKDKQKGVEGKARQNELKNNYNNLVKANKELYPNTGVAEPCIPCMIRKQKGQDPKKHFIKFNVKGPDGKPLSDISIKLELPDGNVVETKSDKGNIEIKNIEPGDCKIETDWKDLTIDQVVFWKSW